MGFLIAGMILVGFIGIVNLIFAIGVVRRLREHSVQLANMGTGVGGNSHLRALPIGEEVGEFETTTVDGVPLNRDMMADETMVAFFGATCKPCIEKMPSFLKYAQTGPRRREQVVAVVVGDGEEAATMAEELQPAALVSVEKYGGPLGSAFQVTSYPTVLVTERDEQGRVVVTAEDMTLARPAVVA